jgi:hypothetical protein
VHAVLDAQRRLVQMRDADEIPADAIGRELDLENSRLDS